MIFLVLCAACCILYGGLFGFLAHISHKSILVSAPSSSDATLYLKRGHGLLRASYLAKEAGYVSRAWHFRLLALYLGASRSLQAGEYKAKQGETLASLIEKMKLGKVYHRTITIPEGLSNKQIQSLLEKNTFIEMDVSSLAEEGIYAPNTYHFPRGVQASTLLSIMRQNQEEILDTLWGNKPVDFIFSSKKEVLTLASIIEKETAIAGERTLIAGVFINRLKKKMRLQSDPTIIYGITKGLPLKRALTRKDVRTKTDYNTYRIKGLPPTPIANPGLESIRSVFYPGAVDYLYFVADGKGGHAFAKTYEEHLVNVRVWRAYKKETQK
ncbi:endolytic transglycosylase MltG [Temperatibacter marinus]|uniref:Endolytic murein transglycosylase n=1 Tax=Temperatibacter marinus TaxID=1456591 RepID=A0AA52HA90_9PROT|nr:endolytic transglycosylase MltG [Temperatibacter marinus]WND02348.1 endolytic transglycosylase MltG [Temperatibacter marinus]